MNTAENTFVLTVGETEGHCPIGEIVGTENSASKKIPVFSCEGACIRGEIARRAANLVAKNDPYRRGCHGELITVPKSSIAVWALTAEKAILIDGCFLRCHGRIMENLFDKDKLIQFDALSYYKKYNEIFDMDEVPEVEKNEVAKSVADWVLKSLQGLEKGERIAITPSTCSSKCCGGKN
jgi:uncharacterized metal-binding protein